MSIGPIDYNLLEWLSNSVVKLPLGFRCGIAYQIEIDNKKMFKRKASLSPKSFDRDIVMSFRNTFVA